MGLQLDIETLVKDLLPGGEVRGDEFWCNCPFHPDKTPSFSVNIQTGAFHCFGCGIGGSLRELVEKLGWNWEEIREKYSNGIKPKKTSSSQKDPKKEEGFQKLKRVWESADTRGKISLLYLDSRGIKLKALPPICRELKFEDGTYALLVAGFDTKGRLSLLQKIPLNEKGQRLTKRKPFFKGSVLKGAFSFLGFSSAEEALSY